MAGQKVDVIGDGIVAAEAGRGIGYAMGTTKPADNAKGYAPYCVFVASNGLFVNIGDKSAANFDSVGDVDGSLLANTISEFTSAAGVTVDGVLLKDGNVDLELGGKILFDDQGTTYLSGNEGTDNISVFVADAEDFRFGANAFTALTGSSVLTNTISETTASAGVTVDGLLIKDGGLAATLAVEGGAGIVGDAESYATGVVKIGGIYVTQVLIDLTGLDSSGTGGDIVGDLAGGAAHIGQITAARNGTIIGGTIRCLEVPTTALKRV